MEFERDEMFRLMTVKLSAWRSSCAANLVAGKPMATKNKKPAMQAPKPGGKSEKKKEAAAQAAPVETWEADTTPPGMKKDMSKPMLNQYHPKQVEAAWYSWWEKEQFFHANADNVLNNPDKKKFIMVIPPPNVTGALHLGHALMLAIEDSITRWRRMQGYETLWLPGCDHAGISCQSVVEKQLWKTEKKTRHDYGREEFLKRVWQWKNDYGGRIDNQFKRMGISVDWKRFAFTLDETRSKAVTEAFVRMYEKKLIYRASRLVNWSSTLHTALSDIEVEYIELDGPTDLEIPGHSKDQKYTFGELTKFSYKVKGSDKILIVATTRLETMLGDVAVAVHPQDPRYKDYIGMELEHPFCPDRVMKIIADDVLVDMNFGTGAVKITPAHDPNDFNCGKRHGLEQITVINQKGAINERGGMFAGMMRYEARNAIYAELEKRGMIHGKEKNPMRIPICGKSKDIIEPLILPQWYVSCAGMAKRSTDAVRNGELTILPKSEEQVWFKWLDNIQDWCISRQLWWGHRIPVYLAKIPGVIDFPDINNDEHYVVGRDIEEARSNAAKKWNVDPSIVELSQDEDVLDTWFSSGIFPFSTMGWPDVESKDLKAFFPGDLLETGGDILFFWVARMVMMSLELTDKLPFKTVFLHPMVRDENGAKMSKSKGNVIDPLEVMDSCELDVLLQKLKDSNLTPKEIKESCIAKAKDFPQGIPECGTDALRFALLSYMLQSSINLDVKRVVGYKEFCNKLWNINKFALSNFPEGFQPHVNGLEGVKADLSLADKWVLTRLNKVIQSTNQCFETYNFGQMTQGIYDFWYKEMAAIYLESIKPVMKKDGPAKVAALNTLYFCLDAALKMLSPTMPYLTEELYQRLPHIPAQMAKSICIAPFPTGCMSFAEAERQMETIQFTCGKIRSQLASLNVPSNARPTILLQGTSDEMYNLFSAERDVIQANVRSGETVILRPNDKEPEGVLKGFVNESIFSFVKIEGAIDIKNEINRLQKRMDQLNGLFEGQNKKMNIPNYEEKVPEKVRITNQTKLDEYKNEIAEVTKQMDLLNKYL